MTTAEDRESLTRDFRLALANETAHDARMKACRAVADGLSHVGQSLWTWGWISRDHETTGLGTAIEIAADLANSAVSLLEQDLTYSAAALVRQLVEVEYLMWRFSDAPAECASWLSSTPQEIRERFKPAEMRRSSGGVFRDREYWTHCDVGGHPSPKARLVLRDHSPALGSHRWLWADLGQHLERLFGLVRAATARQSLDDAVDSATSERVATAIAEWHASDPLATRLPEELLAD